MIAFDQLALQSGAAVLDTERLIAGIRFAITSNSVDSELTPVWINEKPSTRDFDAISNCTRLRKELTNVPAGMIRRETPLFFWYMSLVTSPTRACLCANFQRCLPERTE